MLPAQHQQQSRPPPPPSRSPQHAADAPPECLLDVFADPRSVRDLVKAILHTIFFTRFFPALVPRTRPVLGLTLPCVDDDELETMIDQRVADLERQLDANRPPRRGEGAAGGGGGRGQLTVQFFEKKRRRAWLARNDDEVCWECWTIKVTVAEARNENERAKVRRAMEQTLHNTAMKIVTFADRQKDHIPPITTPGGQPFPFKIQVDQSQAGWAARMGMY